MQENVEISPTARKIIQQLPDRERQELTSLLGQPEKLFRDAHRLKGYEDRRLVRSGTRRFLFRRDNNAWVLVLMYDRSYLDFVSSASLTRSR